MRLKSLFSFKAKVIEPCTKLLSKFKLKFDKPSLSLRAPTFRRPRRRSRPRLRTKTVRFRKPFSIKSIALPRCHRPKPKLRLRSSKFKKTFRISRPHRRSEPPTKPVPKVRIAELLTVLFSLRKAKDIEDDIMEGSDHVRMTDVTSVSVSDAKEPFPSPITPGYVRNSEDSKKESSDDLEEVEDACRSFENYLAEMIVEEGKLKDLMDVEELLYCWRNLKNPIFVDLVCRFYGELCKDLFAPSEESESQETTTSE